MFNTEELYQDVGTELLRRRGKDFGPDLLSAINATLRAHAANVGKPIDQVIAEL